MKIFFVIMTTFLVQVSASTFAQQFTLKADRISLKQVFSQIRKQTGYTVFCESDLINKTKPISIDVQNKPLKEVLDNVLENQNLAYTINNKSIIVSAKEKSFIDKVIDYFVNIDVTGRVVDEKGEPIAGATIKVKGTSISTIADAEGRFTLKNISEDATLEISSIGFKVKEIKVAKDLGQIKMEISVGALDEVSIVNTGYQTLPKERVTGSFVQIDNKLLNRAVSTNILERLQGVTSGLIFNAKPLSNQQSQYTIRGISTINANPNPLIVVDGFPYDESANLSNVINNINPNDVESISVLKDAAAASIWGVRAGNGVIVITTKKGKFGQKSEIQINSNVNIVARPDLYYLKSMSSSDFIDLEKELFAKNIYDSDLNNTFSYPLVSPIVEILNRLRKGSISESTATSQIDALRTKDVRNDINKYLLQNAVNQQYAVNFSGGSDKHSYYSSIGYDRNMANNIGDRYNRLTLRMDNTYKPIKNLEANYYLNYVQGSTYSNGLNFTPFLSNGTARSAPYAQFSDGNGNPLSVGTDRRIAYTDTAKVPGLLDWRYRPLDELVYNNNKKTQSDARVGLNLKYTFLSSLNLEVKYQYQKIIEKGLNDYSSSSYFVRNLVNKYASLSAGIVKYPIPNADILDIYNLDLDSYNLRAQINFNKKWKKHSLAILGGSEVRESQTNSNTHRNYGYSPQNGTSVTQIDYITSFPLNPKGSGSSTIPNLNDVGGTLNRYFSYYANGSYTFSDKYTLSGSGRLDASNFFGVKANQRVVPLYSIGLLWDVAKEDFYQFSAIPYLKIRGTYGYNGNTYNGVSAYSTITYAGSEGSPIGVPFARLTSPPNPELRWERIKMANLGLDFASANNRLSGTLEYYSKKGIDLIGAVALDPTSGFASFTANRASIKAQGLDLILNSVNVSSSNFNWQSNFLFSFNKDRVTSYEKSALTVNDYLFSGNGPVIEKPLFSLHSYKWAGLNPVNGSPRVFVGGVPTDYSSVAAKIQLGDLVYNGPQNPTYYGAFRNTFTYRNASLSLNVSYKFGYFYRKASIRYSPILTNTAWGGLADYTLRWKKTGDELTTNVPSLPLTADIVRDNVYQNADILVERGDHIRLQDVRLGYNFNQLKFKSLPFKELGLFLYGSNLGIIWRANESQIDPDFNGSIPPAQSFAFGLNIKF